MASRLRFGVSTPGGPLASEELASVSDAVGRDPEIVLWYQDFASAPPLTQVEAVARRHADAVVSWEPWLWRTDAAGESTSIVAKINAGSYDDYLRRWAADMGACRHDILLRFAHEFNGTWYPWSTSAGTDADAYLAAWRRAHDLFDEHGGGNVRWVWAPDAGHTAELSRWYPGDDYVDVLGVDGYNWGTTLPGSRWTGPAELFADALEDLRRICDAKPILLTEVACAEEGGDKAQWIGELVRMLAREPRVIGLIWFHHDKETDWRLTSSPAAAAAMAAALSEAAA